MEKVTIETKPLLFSFEESARLLGGISPWSLRRHAQRKNIRVVHLGLRVFVDAQELDRIRREGLPSLSEIRGEERLASAGA
jgi:hypothetical protein